MRKIEAIIQPFKLDEVRQALADAGVASITITDVRGHGRQRGHTEVYRGQEYDAGFLLKSKLEIVVLAEECEAIVQTLMRAARTGKIGDGKIFIYDVADVVRIRNGNCGRTAL